MVKKRQQSQAKDSRITDTTSSIITAFHPEQSLFAAASLSLNSWHIRMVDPSTSTTRNTFSLDKGQVCTCLAWGNRDNSSRERTKKRKVDQEALLAVGTNEAINLYVAAQDEKIGTLSGHKGSVASLAFCKSRLFSAGVDGQAIEWSTTDFQKIRSIQVEKGPLSSINCSDDIALAASYTIHHLLDFEELKSYTNHTTPVHTLLIVDSNFISAANDDRYMNVFSTEHLRTIVAESDVRRISGDQELLCALTKDGSIELFSHPFSIPSGKRRKSAVLTAKSKITVKRPDGEQVDLLDLHLRDENLIIAWSEGARLVFESISLYVADDLIDNLELVRTKLPGLGAINGIRELETKAYTDGTATIGAGNDVADLSMEESEVDEEEPTLADRLQSMEVTAPKDNQVIKIPSVGTLSTVLTQALKSGDQALLESCLHHRDSKVIMNTLRRLDPTLVVSLLDECASRIATRPGRTVDLGVWVKYSIIVHGGYLSSIPSLMKTLGSLHNVLRSQAAALPRLLALQGRLDMVHAQIELRREGGVRAVGEAPSDVEYIEGESDVSDEEIGMDDDLSDGQSESGSDVSDGFSDDSQDVNEFAALDATMEMMRSDDEPGDIIEEDEDENDDEDEDDSD